ncbi:hypothetical protein EJ04DRAFT_550418 [Polyplosphaeria fusca]|uniref:F-box domain-containing protein n=1 Tax=Polyplosphaeria fusca TaxID=682080 RepID=A0A9P4R3Z9_9PLEO|nr:hypothetical protein EJ04DRAFT_550418 [Polyplosphaeria fusca]
MDLGKKNFPPLPSQGARESENAAPKLPLVRSIQAPRAGDNPRATTIDDLPDELLLYILEYLPGFDSHNLQLPTLTNISRVNHRLHNVVIEKLYAVYDSRFIDPYLFLRTLMMNPVASRKVQRVSFTYGPYTNRGRTRYARSVKDRQIIKSGFKSLDLPDWKIWATTCNNDDNNEMLYAAVLMHTPNVISLRVDDNKTPHNIPHWIQLIRHAVGRGNFGRLHTFSLLEEVWINIDSLRLTNLVPVFRLPSLRRLTLLGLVETSRTVKGDPYPFKWPIYVASLPLEQLSLLRSSIDVKVLTRIMDSCRSLKRLNCSRDSDPWVWAKANDPDFPWNHDTIGSDGERFAPFHYPTLAAALERHSETLEELHIWDAIGELDVDRSVELSESRFGVIPSLTSLSHLSSLRLPLGALVDPAEPCYSTLAERLPPSLTSAKLYLGGRENRTIRIPALEQFAANAAAYVPSLECFVLEVDYSRVAKRGYVWDRIREPLQENNVRFLVQGRIEKPCSTESDSDFDSDSDSDSDFGSENDSESEPESEPEESESQSEEI